ncbi:MAG: hypothetical protein IT223_10930 [Crocinitomicaceae bacterium]|nr:hypothetical protein [Crocinitomicaceae bacterium]
MNTTIIHSIVLLIALFSWGYGAFPLLRYGIELSEGRFRSRLLLWLLFVLIAVYFIRRSLFLLCGWPPPDSWANRLFPVVLLLFTYVMPFAVEFIKSFLKKK